MPRHTTTSAIFTWSRADCRTLRPKWKKPCVPIRLLRRPTTPSESSWRNQNRMEPAIRHFERAVQFDPDFAAGALQPRLRPVRQWQAGKGRGGVPARHPTRSRQRARAPGSRSSARRVRRGRRRRRRIPRSVAAAPRISRRATKFAGVRADEDREIKRPITLRGQGPKSWRRSSALSSAQSSNSRLSRVCRPPVAQYAYIRCPTLRHRRGARFPYPTCGLRPS